MDEIKDYIIAMWYVYVLFGLVIIVYCSVEGLRTLKEILNKLNKV